MCLFLKLGRRNIWGYGDNSFYFFGRLRRSLFSSKHTVLKVIIIRLVKMESESEITTFGLKMMMKCDLDLFLNRFMWEESKVDFVTEFATLGKILPFYE